MKERRPPVKIDSEKLRRLWPSRLSDDEVARRMGHGRGVLRRHAVKMGLPASRRTIWAKSL